MSHRNSNRPERARSNQRRRPHSQSPLDASLSPGKSAPVRRSGSAQSEQSRQHLRDRSRESDGEAGDGKPERVQKVLAHAGLGSRRHCEDLIKQGRVSIDGQVVRELGTRVDPARARIAVDGEAIRLESMVYYAVNKPKGYVSTNSDPAGRPRVVDLLPEIPQRVYTVGRLDEESTGLMILTNDGELANRLAHPRFGVEKLYRALVAGAPEPEVLDKLTSGVWLSNGKVRAKRARLVGRQGQANVLELVLAEGKNREIRRMLAKLGHKVMSLQRLAVGPVSIKGLSAGAYRSLSRHEVDLLWKVANGAALSSPRFHDGGSSSRSHRDSSQHREADRARSGTDHAGPRRNRRRDSGREHTHDRSRTEGPPPMKPHGEVGQPRAAHRGDENPRRPHGAPRQESPRSGTGRPMRKKPPAAKRPAPEADHLPAQLPAKRRIIGLGFPQQPKTRAFKSQTQRKRKPDSPRKHRSPPAARIKKPPVRFRPQGTDGEHE